MMRDSSRRSFPRVCLRFALVLVAALLLFQPSLPAQRGGGAAAHLEFGNPGGDGPLLDKGYFVIRYDTDRRIPEWVAYRLRRGEATGAVDRTGDFREDEALDEDARSRKNDYARSGFDQGHMAPAEDFSRSQQAMSTTFLLSNMAPQRPKLNRGKWKALEGQVRRLLVDDDYTSLWIVSGTLFTNTRPSHYKASIGADEVAVPTDFFKVILARDAAGDFTTYGFVMPNSFNPLRGTTSDYEESVDEVERLSGLDFFSGLSDSVEDSIESQKPEWPF